LKKTKTVCRYRIHSARGLAVGVLTPIPLRLDMGRPRPDGSAHYMTTRDPDHRDGVSRKASNQTWESSKVLVS
jgi:hypothetical protein